MRKFNEENSLIKRLIDNSHPYKDPMLEIDWNLFDLNTWWLPPSSLSLCGVELYEKLSEKQKITLSQYEFINFIEKALWLENIFMTRISRHLINPMDHLLTTTYQLHEFREEAGHSLMFIELINKTEFKLDSNCFKKPKLATWVGLFSPYRSSLFWLSVVIGEQIPNHLNQYIRKNKAKISKIIYQIVTKHAIDEARHIAYAKEILENNNHLKWIQNPKYNNPIINLIFKQFIDAFFYPKAALYEAAGLNDGKKWEQLAAQNPLRKEFIYKSIGSTIAELKKLNISIKWG